MKPKILCPTEQDGSEGENDKDDRFDKAKNEKEINWEESDTMKMIKACVHYFLSIFLFLTKW